MLNPDIKAHVTEVIAAVLIQYPAYPDSTGLPVVVDALKKKLPRADLYVAD